MVHFLKGNWHERIWQSLVSRYVIHYHELHWIEPLLVITIIFHSCFCSFNKHLLNINVVPVIDAEDKAANNRHRVSALVGIFCINSVTTNLLLLSSISLPSSSYHHHYHHHHSGDKFSIKGEGKRRRKNGRLLHLAAHSNLFFPCSFLPVQYKFKVPFSHQNLLWLPHFK